MAYSRNVALRNCSISENSTEYCIHKSEEVCNVYNLIVKA